MLQGGIARHSQFRAVEGYKVTMVDVPKTGETQEDGESREFKLAQTDTKTKQEATITDDNRQKTWQEAFDQGHENDPHPSDIRGLPAIQSSFGIDFGDGQILTAKGLEKKEYPFKNNLSIQYVSAENLFKIAIEEHNHPTKWMHDPPLCNLFLDTVARKAHVPLPWDAKHIPRSGGSGGMNEQLSKSKDFDKVWSTDYSNRMLSLQNFQYFELKKGDLIVWDVPDSIEKGGISHCAIAGENRKVIYAGSDQSSNGCGYCDIVYFTGTMKLPMSYGTPTAIYRYKHMTK